MIANQMIAYHVYQDPSAPIPMDRGYTYVLAGNGLWLAARRAGLSVILPLLSYSVRGLPLLTPVVDWQYPRIPAVLMQIIVRQAQAARDTEGHPVEWFGQLSCVELPDCWEWQLLVPDQIRTAYQVHYTAPPLAELEQQVVLDIHSHHTMRAYFSATDDADDTAFQVSAVIGTLDRTPTIQVRVGVYGIVQYPIEPGVVLDWPWAEVTCHG